MWPVIAAVVSKLLEKPQPGPTGQGGSTAYTPTTAGQSPVGRAIMGTSTPEFQPTTTPMPAPTGAATSAPVTPDPTAPRTATVTPQPSPDQSQIAKAVTGGSAIQPVASGGAQISNYQIQPTPGAPREESKADEYSAIANAIGGGISSGAGRLQHGPVGSGGSTDYTPTVQRVLEMLYSRMGGRA